MQALLAYELEYLISKTLYLSTGISLSNLLQFYTKTMHDASC